MQQGQEDEATPWPAMHRRRELAARAGRVHQLAVLRAGAVVNPINVMLTPPGVAYVLADCGSVAVLTSAAHLPRLREVAAELPGVRLVQGLDSDEEDGFATLFTSEPLTDREPADPAALCTIGYTSGTTGHPKGAMQSQQSVLLNCALTATMHGRTAADVVVTALPAPHVYGNVAINGTFLAGGTVALMERFAADEVLALIARHRATMFEGVPAMYAMLLAAPALAGADLTSLRVCTVGGQTIANATIEAWQRRSGAPLIELWGMTEIAGLGTTHALYAPPVPGSIGVALPGIAVRVADLDDAGRDAPPGVPGELMVRGPIVMMGSYGNPGETARTIEPDGDELIDFTRNRLAAYKRPRQVVFLPSLPATSTGKIMRRKLADAHLALKDAR